MAGALPEAELLELTSSIGFRDGRILERFDCFRDSTAKEKTPEDLGIHGVNFFARK